MKKFLLLNVLIFSGIFINAQNPKSFYKTGVEFNKNGNYADAIVQLSKCIELDPDYADAYIERAVAYEKKGNIKEACADYNRATIFMPNDEELSYNAGRLYYELKEYDKAIVKLEKSIIIKHTFLPPYKILTYAYLETGNLSKAKATSEDALKRKSDAENNYLCGYVLYIMGQHAEAEKYLNTSIKKDEKYLDSYYILARIKNESKAYDAAVSLCTQAIGIDPKDLRFYRLRSNANKNKLNLTAAIDDISKAILVKPDDPQLYFERGNLYQEFAQFQNAINDYSKAISMDNKFFDAYFERAQMFEEITNYKAAIKDYEYLFTISKGDEKATKLLATATKRLFDLNKESNKPEVQLTDPLPVNELVLKIPGNKTEITLKGKIIDESDLKKLSINGTDVQYTSEEGISEFLTTIDITGLKSVTVSATDVYDNTENKEYTIRWTEINPPDVAIIAPYASDNGEIYLSSNDPNLYIEGNIKDESKIQTILVDGVSASFKVDDFNPQFSATISIQNKSKFTVRVIDENGNEAQKEFTFNREGAELSENNPMGKTWVIFIENSDYENFPSLEGPAKDVSSIRSALANYQVHNFIHKKDMTKTQLEHFFNIELRDLVRSNRVTSLMIWYAGHGKFINETGYWIPIDARRDDEFSYFPVNNLKGSMQLYSKYITHLLLVTDACESGPTFYQAMRSTGDAVKDCNDWQATRFKSSQVFTSAGYELAIDNSQFTKTFASSLSNNPNSCIPIETIVNKVTQAVEANNQQKPKFGKIAGMEDENGTFFFISK